MYLWRTKSLAEDIKNNVVTQADELKYYITYSVLTLVSMYALERGDPGDGVISIVAYGLLIITVFVWSRICFLTNKGNDGKNLIGRISMLSVPLTIKATLLLIVFAIVGGAILISTISEDKLDIYTQYLAAVSAIFLSNFIFFRINKHLKYINS